MVGSNIQNGVGPKGIAISPDPIFLHMRWDWVPVNISVNFLINASLPMSLGCQKQTNGG